MPVLSIDEVTKRYPSVVAVDDVSFDVADGEFVSILGPSGSGKSTILRMIAGFETPTEGTIRIDGDRVDQLPPFERDVNMVFQNLALFPHLTVSENIEFGLKESGVPKAERKTRVKEMLEIVELTGYGDRGSDELSGGEQQRVALARALVNRPKIVLFDEPLASLDRKLRQHMQKELQRIQNETGITFLYVTHDQEVALAVSDRMVLLNEGQIQQAGTAEEIYDRPSSEFVADFIGDVNAIPATVDSVDGDSMAVSVNGSPYTLSKIRTPDGNAVDAGDDVTLGVRPHEVDVRVPENGTTASFDGTVTNRVYTGEGTTYTIDTPVVEFTADVENAAFEIEDEVSVVWSDATVHVFPRGS